MKIVFICLMLSLGVSEQITNEYEVNLEYGDKEISILSIVGLRAKEFSIKLIDFTPNEKIDNWKVFIFDSNHELTVFENDDLFGKSLITSSDLIRVQAKQNNKLISGKVLLEIGFNPMEINYKNGEPSKLYINRKQGNIYNTNPMVAFGGILIAIAGGIDFKLVTSDCDDCSTDDLNSFIESQKSLSKIRALLILIGGSLIFFGAQN